MNSSETNYRKNLDEISIIRPVLIILLVLYHAMAIHTGNWDLPSGCERIGVYKFVGRLSYSFMLETFVFISGYIWAYQIKSRGLMSLGTLVVKKAKRLLVPCWLFGIAYYFIFEHRCNTALLDNAYLILDGIGHLWFCLMLFWCFVFARILLKIPFPILAVLLITLSIFSWIELPFRLSLTMYYLIFFFAGYYFEGIREKMASNITPLVIVFEWLLFFACFAISVH